MARALALHEQRNGSASRRCASAIRMLRKLVNSSSARPPVMAHSSAMRSAARVGNASWFGSGRSGAT